MPALPPSDKSSLSSDRSDLFRRARILRSLIPVMITLFFFSTALMVFLFLLSGHWLLVVGFFYSLFSMLAFGFSYWLCRPVAQARPAFAFNYRLSSLLLVWPTLTIIFLYYWFFGTAVAVPLAFIVPIGLTLVLSTLFEVGLITVLCLLVGLIMYIGQDILKVIKPVAGLEAQFLTIVNLVVVVIVLPVVVLLLLIPVTTLRRTLRSLAERTDHLQTILAELEARRNTGQRVSQQVVSLATQLSTTAAQQASGSQEQVAVVSQVGVASSELAGTASAINELAGQIDNATMQVVSHLVLSERTAENCIECSQQGLVSVEQTLTMSQEVAHLYGGLLESLENLANRNSNVQQIVQLLNGLANETHLLSLNAAIEAAGAGQQGQRFAVVAQEVKQLASRSAEASRQVVGLLTEGHHAAQQARQAAQQGAAKADHLLEVAGSTGRLIYQLRRLTAESQSQVLQVNEAVSEMQTMVVMIKNATGQQHTATRQVQEALNGLGTVANQTAESSLFISQAVLEMEELSQNLNSKLVTTI